jgi:NNP family nitrate/nitrite transporter-like MFS transporter
MKLNQKAVKIELANFSKPQMRAFHMSWFAFFLCFFAWFGIAPLMAVVREELALTQAQIGNTIIASVAMTVVARLFIGWLCDRIGPRRAYTWLLVLGSLPVMGIGFAQTYESFLLFRLGIGVIGASFVITQYHTSLMFAPNCVGTANATTAGWGNMGGGATQLVMPLVFTALMSLGLSEFWGWRAAMVVAGMVCMLTGLAYYRFTQDTPEGNYSDLIAAGKGESQAKATGAFIEACKDYRVWALFLVYGACFGVELTINNIAAMYFMDYFDLGLTAAGMFAASFGLMNLFARTLGGFFGDTFGKRWGLKGRVYWLAVALACEGVALMLFSRMTILPLALASMIVFSLFVQMSEGATFSVVPFVKPGALGAVAGIVGAGGNFGAVMAGFLFRTEAIAWPTALLVMGTAVLFCAGVTTLVRFSATDELNARRDLEARLTEVAALAEAAAIAEAEPEVA